MNIVVTGAAGQVGRALVPALDAIGLGAIGLDHTALDVSSLAAVEAMIAEHKPDAIVHCAAYTNVDGCELDPELAMRVNGLGPSNLARAAGDAHIVYLSTDYVFDGTKATPYVERDEPNPISVYGRSKRAGERALDVERHAIVRTSWVCGDTGPNMIATILRLLSADKPLRFVTDQRACPTLVADLVPALVRTVNERRTGIWHITNQGAVSAYEFAQAVAEAAGYDRDRIEPITSADLDRPAPRPANSVLASERVPKSEQLPDFRASLPALISNLRH
jgi:dTDP-4-dehydrorhamnose reductase